MNTFNTKSFLRILILLFWISSSIVSVFTAPLINVPVSVIQPNGDTLNCFASGDEFYNWLHDAEGFTIMQDPNTGFYVYADKENDTLVPTKLIPGKNDPAGIGLKPQINISPEKMELFREQFLEMTPQEIGLAPSTGTINNIVIFIRFSDESEFTTPVSYYDDMFNSYLSGTNSMHNYFKEVSYNQLEVFSTFYPSASGLTILSFQDQHPRAYYMPYNSVTNPMGYEGSERTEREQTLLKNAVEYVTSEIPADLNIDADGDGKVDNVCFVISGSTTAWSTLLWPHRWVLTYSSAFINGKQVWDYNFQLEDFLQTSGNGVLCHEMFHSLGAPDLYRYYDGTIEPVYLWDLMAYTTNPPQHMGAYMKYKYGNWIETIPEISVEGIYE